jgi:hypothetical protein
MRSVEANCIQHQVACQPDQPYIKTSAVAGSVVLAETRQRPGEWVGSDNVKQHW